jgi:hypothetical protein
MQLLKEIFGYLTTSMPCTEKGCDCGKGRYMLFRSAARVFTDAVVAAVPGISLHGHSTCKRLTFVQYNLAVIGLVEMMELGPQQLNSLHHYLGGGFLASERRVLWYQRLQQPARIEEPSRYDGASKKARLHKDGGAGTGSGFGCGDAGSKATIHNEGGAGIGSANGGGGAGDNGREGPGGASWDGRGNAVRTQTSFITAKNVPFAAAASALIMALKILRFNDRYSTPTIRITCEKPKAHKDKTWEQLVTELSQIEGIVPGGCLPAAGTIIPTAVSKYFENRFCWHSPVLDFFHFAVCQRMSKLKLTGAAKVKAGLALLYGFQEGALNLTLPLNCRNPSAHLDSLDRRHFLKVNEACKSKSGIKRRTPTKLAYLCSGPSNSVREGICNQQLKLAEGHANGTRGHYYLGFALWFDKARKEIDRGFAAGGEFLDLVEVRVNKTNSLHEQLCCHRSQFRSSPGPHLAKEQCLSSSSSGGWESVWVTLAGRSTSGSEQAQPPSSGTTPFMNPAA